MKRTKNGSVIDFDQKRLERLIAAAILESRVPIRGQELKLIRSAARLSMAAMGRHLGLSHGTVFYWERASRKRLTPLNEVSIRLLCAEELGIQLRVPFSQLVGYEGHEPLEVRVTNRKPSKAEAAIKAITRPSYRGHRVIRVKVDTE